MKVYFELFSEFLLLLLELVHRLLVPAPGLGLQVAGSSRDDSRLLEQGTIEGYRLETGTRGGVRWKNGHNSHPQEDNVPPSWHEMLIRYVKR